jgi:hypothetical protein
MIGEKLSTKYLSSRRIISEQKHFTRHPQWLLFSTMTQKYIKKIFFYTIEGILVLS